MGRTDPEKKAILSLATKLGRVCKPSPHLRDRLERLGMPRPYQGSAPLGIRVEPPDDPAQLLRPS